MAKHYHFDSADTLLNWYWVVLGQQTKSFLLVELLQPLQDNLGEYNHHRTWSNGHAGVQSDQT